MPLLRNCIHRLIEKALEHLEIAINLTENEQDRSLLQSRINQV